MVHQLNVTQITQMDTPVVHLQDGADLHLLIVHVVVALITVKVFFVLFLTEEAYSHSWLHTSKLGQTPLCKHG